MWLCGIALPLCTNAHALTHSKHCGVVASAPAYYSGDPGFVSQHKRLAVGTDVLSGFSQSCPSHN